MRFSLPQLLALMLSLTGSACCSEPEGYYNSAEGKSGEALRQALHEIIDGHTVLEYTNTDEAFALTDRDPNAPSKVILIYSRRSEPALCCTGEWNREHVWPNSLGIDRQLPSYSDIHNLRPSDYQVNSERGHKYFDESDPDSPAYSAPSHPEAPLSTADLDSWEPPESIKGDIARAMFYMAVRYEGDGGEPDLELTDDVSEITTNNSKMGRLTTLLVWHLIDPVSAEERFRNDAVFTYQGNRNPFVDHPEWVNELWPSPLLIELETDMTNTSASLTWPTGIPRSVVEISEDMEAWREIDETPQESDGILSIDIALTVHPRRFYRLTVR
ncbi:MAG: endonuclease I [Pseudoalteromonas tetraodonis]|jgi:endonuclease I